MLVEFLTALACSAERNVVRGYPEPGPAFDVLSQVGRNVTGNVKHPIAFCADEMVMVKGLVIKMSDSVQSFDLFDHAVFRQKVEVAVNRRQTDRRLFPADQFVKLFGRRVDTVFLERF